MFNEFQSRLLITGRVILETPLRIGAGRATDPISTDLPVVRDALGHPYIPGSSLKGVLRSRIEALIRGVMGTNTRYACDPTDNDKWCVIKKAENETNFTERVLRESCLVCRVFGSPWLASHVLVRDLPVSSLWLGPTQFVIRDGVAIDRDTETAADQKKYDYEVVPAGVEFILKIIAENLQDPWMRGALLTGLAQFEDGNLSLGGARSRGLGQIRLEWNAQIWENREGLLDQIQGRDGKFISDEEKSKWRQAFANKLSQALGEVNNAQATA